METSGRTPLQAVQFNNNADITDISTVKNSVTILTYEILRTDVSVEIASYHTIRDLVDVVCNETCVGMNEKEFEHMWNVDSFLDGKKYESGDMPCVSIHRANKTKLGNIRGGCVEGAKLVLNYDYGSTSTIELLLKAIVKREGEEKSCLPRRAPLPRQLTFVPYDPATVLGDDAANIDELLPDLSKFCFGDGYDQSLELFLFQPGRKKIQAFITKFYGGCKHMIHVPEKFASLEEMFHAINLSCRLDRPNFDYNWFGVNIFPFEDRHTLCYEKYQDASSIALDITVARECSFADKARLANKVIKTFPKCAAAAGYNQKNKPSKSVERGWIIYRNRSLVVCRGSSKSMHSNSPSPGVWDGNNKHEPVDDNNVVGKISLQANSLQEIFCAAEALW